MAETTKELQKKKAQVPERVERIRASRVFQPSSRHSGEERRGSGDGRHAGGR
jgi:hypothetical protein